MFLLPGHLRVRPLCLSVFVAVHGMAIAQSDTFDMATLPTVKVIGKSAGNTRQSYTVEESNTATPLALPLRETPQSVSVITRQRIADQGLVNVMDVVNNVTGLSVHQYETNRAQFTARGFDIDTLMIDGVPTTWDQPWSSGEIFTSLSMYDRVEVVRGSTGLTTGAGDPSAAINLVRKRATSRTLTGTADLGVGTYGQRRAQVDVSTALNASQTLRGRVVGEYARRASEADLLVSKSNSLYATFEADLGTHTLLSGGVSRQEHTPRGAMWGGLPLWYADGSRTNWDRSKTTSSDWVRWDSVYETYFASLEHRFANDWKVRASLTRGNRAADSHLSYLSGAPDRVTGLGMDYFNASYKVDTQQDDVGLQVSGPFTLWGRTHEASLGASYSKQRWESQSRDGSGGAAPDFNNWTPGTLAEPAWGPLVEYGHSRTRQQALYGAARLSNRLPSQVP